MNHHCIDYMTKQRQQMEIEDCKRGRLLQTAGLGNSGLIHRTVEKLGRRLRRAIARLKLRKEDYPIRLSVVHFVKHRKEEVV